MRRSGLVRIAHAEIDNVFSLLTRLEFQGLYLREYVRWKPFNAVKAVADGHEYIRLLEAGPLLIAWHHVLKGAYFNGGPNPSQFHCDSRELQIGTD